MAKSNSRFSHEQVKVMLKRESEVWIYSYADLITNLMAFFILLLTVRSADTQHLQKLKDSFSKLKGVAPVAGQVSDSEFNNSVTEMIAKLPESYQVAVQKSAEGISLTFMGGLFFETLSTDLSPQAQQILTSLAPLIQKMPKSFRIDVSGHSDSRPIVDNEYFPSNWELSAARAGAVVRFLQEKGVSAKRMRAIGYADTQGVSGDLDQNRRVVIRIGKGLTE